MDVAKGLRRIGAVSVLVLGLAASGCTAGLAAGPPDLPFHAEDQRLTLHWQLRPGGGQMRADGRIERHHPEISDVWLQLVGVDAAGRVVSFSPPVHVRWAASRDTETFLAILEPTGAEARFLVQVRSLAYEEGAPTKG